MSPPGSARSTWTRSPGRLLRDRPALLAMSAWTVAVIAVFPDAAMLRGALFYFDVTDLNYPYRAFLARELAAGRVSFWLPDLACGMPLFSESQAGYFHPLKPLLYPWMATWKAFNLDTVLSVWLAGAGAYGWLRGHAGAVGAMAGAAVFALGGFTWAHLIHTSRVNALASVPFALWALEAAWAGRARLRATALGAAAIAAQVLAGNMQDAILTCGALGLYAAIRAAGERSWPGRARVLSTAAGMMALGALLSAARWVPSAELLGRSARSGGLSHDDMTYGSWHPELLPRSWSARPTGRGPTTPNGWTGIIPTTRWTPTSAVRRSSSRPWGRRAGAIGGRVRGWGSGRRASC